MGALENRAAKSPCPGGSACQCGPGGAADFNSHVAPQFEQLKRWLQSHAREFVPAWAVDALVAIVLLALSNKWSEIENLNAYTRALCFRNAKRARRECESRAASDEVFAVVADADTRAAADEAEEREQLQLQTAEIELLRKCRQTALSELERKIVEKYEKGVPSRQGAEDLGIPDATYRYKLKQALAKLETCIAAGMAARKRRPQ
jgi:DNA-directed RNA polymerase specialized sigma24 family protein